LATEIVEPAIARLQERTMSTTSLPGNHRRGSAHQHRQRGQEQETRRHAAEVGCHLFGLGWAWNQIAELIRVPGRTLRRWCRDLLHLFRPALPLGRPVVRSPREDRNAVLHFLDEFGPQVGVPALCAGFPEMARAELEDLLKRYRRVWRERNRQPLRVLHWSVIGSVWAIDFTGPMRPIDGAYPYLLAVRDLASGMQLLWRSVTAPTGEAAACELSNLFAAHGPPLVLKSDNGGHFTCPAVQDLLQAHQVESLLSPPHWPRYNGAIEAGIGAMKERTDDRAARAGHVGYWTIDDTAGALAEANALARPHGPTPESLWQGRTPIPRAERDAFSESVQRPLGAEKWPAGPCVAAASDVWSKRAVARNAIRLALEECGYLHYTRRLIPPPIPGRKAASNT
jgi:transposase InsO family protein